MKQTSQKVKTKKISKKQKKKASQAKGSAGSTGKASRNTTKGSLKDLPLEVLVDEIIRRGWEVELSRG